MDDKVYQQEITQDAPFPGEVSLLAPSTLSNPVGTYSPATSKDNVFPVKKRATELLSTALNTRSRKILQEFELQQSGGIQVGNFQEGISGDLRITPSGLTARDMTGLTTFAIDGSDGSAVFRGTVQAADFIISDENGLVSAANFQSDSYRVTSLLDIVTVTGSSSYTDVAGSSLSFTLVRPAKVLITFFANVKLYATDPIREYHIDVAVAIDGITQPEFARQVVSNMNSDIGTCLCFAKTFLIPSGDHTIKLRWSTFSDVSGVNELGVRGLDYCMLGS